jgi:hypothetical protein
MQVKRLASLPEKSYFKHSTPKQPIGTLCTVRVFRLEFTLEDAIGSHACSLEALAGVRPMAFLSGVHFSYQFTL